MKALQISIKAIALGLLVFASMGCGKSRTTGDINVTVTVLTGHTVDLSGIKVQLHQTAMFEFLLQSIDASGTASTASALFEDLAPGKYYVCAWNDKDADLRFSAGDFFGFYPYPVDLAERDEKEVSIEVYVLD